MLRLTLSDSVFTNEFQAFLRSVGQEPATAGTRVVEVGTPRDELDVYLHVWQVLNPAAGVTVE